MGPAFLYMAAVVNLIIGVVLIVTAFRHWQQKLAYGAHLASGLVSLACPVLVCAVLFVSWLWHDAIMLATIFVVAVLPIAAAVAGIAMLVVALCRRRNGKLCAPVLISGIALLLYPLALPAATVLEKIIL